MEELKHREAALLASQAEIERQKAKLKDRESKLQKQQVLSEGTSQKLKIRKEEIDKEWRRVDEMRIEAEIKEAQLNSDRATFESERALILSQKEEKVTLQFELKEQMKAMEDLTEEISRKEKFIR